YAGEALKDDTKLDLKQWDAEGFAVNEDGSIWINVDKLENNTIDFNKLFVHEYAHSNGLNEAQAHYVEEAYADFLSEVSAAGYITVDGKIRNWESTNLNDSIIQQLVSYGPDGIQLKETTIKKSEYTKEELAKLEDDYRTVNMYRKSDLGYSYSLVVDGVLYENITLDSIREGANENEIIINVEGIEPEIYTGTLSRKDVEHIINREYTFYDDLPGSYSSEKTKSSYLSFSDANNLMSADDKKENIGTLKGTIIVVGGPTAGAVKMTIGAITGGIVGTLNTQHRKYGDLNIFESSDRRWDALGDFGNGMVDGAAFTAGGAGLLSIPGSAKPVGGLLTLVSGKTVYDSGVSVRSAAGANTIGYETSKNSNSQLQKAFDVADKYNLSDSVYKDHIITRHGPESTSYLNKSKFNSNFDIKKGIDNALKNSNSIIKPNTKGRSGYIFEYTYSNSIGINTKGKPINTIKVVVDPNGNITTAFPKK
ncbi:hypothetical protein M2142_001866, partial [Fusobacterium sp. PH5-29]|uniref:hypothetical protein n=1 Tax=Fusobacterium sp. PH5-29 TaxID=1742400 RepID=UPI003D25B013